jgi:hypothetical protein
MSAPASRRGFLRDLATLPLIGGGVTLIGSPTAVAAPITESLLDSYDAWLEFERRILQWERYRNTEMNYRLHQPFVMQMYDREGKPKGPATAGDYIPAANPGAQYHRGGEAPASARAALVLSAVGCNWREEW